LITNLFHQTSRKLRSEIKSRYWVGVFYAGIQILIRDKEDKNIMMKQ